MRQHISIALFVSGVYNTSRNTQAESENRQSATNRNQHGKRKRYCAGGFGVSSRLLPSLKILLPPVLATADTHDGQNHYLRTYLGPLCFAVGLLRILIGAARVGLSKSGNHLG
jgi:hypothetical protein